MYRPRGHQLKRAFAGHLGDRATWVRLSGSLGIDWGRGRRILFAFSFLAYSYPPGGFYYEKVCVVILTQQF
jgi:hypothetical protein